MGGEEKTNETENVPMLAEKPQPRTGQLNDAPKAGLLAGIPYNTYFLISIHSFFRFKEIPFSTSLPIRRTDGDEKGGEWRIGEEKNYSITAPRDPNSGTRDPERSPPQREGLPSGRLRTFHR